MSKLKLVTEEFRTSQIRINTKQTKSMTQKTPNTEKNTRNKD